MSAAGNYLKPHPEGVCLQIKAVPRSSRNQIGEALGDRLKIKIKAPPVDSAANDELIRFLAKKLALPKSDVQLTQGQANRNKTVLLRGLSSEDANHRLAG